MSMFRFCFILWAGLAVMACTDAKPVFQCTDSIGCVDIAPGKPIKIGVLQSLSGKVAPLGHEQIRGLELAMETIGGQIAGHTIVLKVEDTGCTTEGGANSVLKIIADPQMVAIFGTTCSGAAQTASHAMSHAGLTMISGNNSAPFLTSVNNERAPYWQEGYFRVSKNEEHAGKAAAIYAFDSLKVTKVATINDGDIYTRGLTEGFVREFEKLGGQIVLDTAIAKGEEQMGPVLTAVLNVGAQLLFSPLFQPEGNHLVVQARNIPGLDRLILMSDGALIESSFINEVQDKGTGMYFVGPSQPEGAAASALVTAYQTRYQEKSSASYFLFGFDAANLLFKAIADVAVNENDGSLHVGRKALRDAMYRMKNIQGVTGSLSCNEFGDCSVPDFVILRLDDPQAGVEGLQSNVMARYTFE
ncbi:MAG: branched-chain amino acid ABC transporter substrate-binding protein [Proteobacteria bacterium]|nr:branched-chain amino acid ABC transporter substrate-binding protein [Pseudomonadota bacterium]